MKRITAFILSLTVAAATLSAQSNKKVTIQGTVTCEDGGEAIEFASVVLPRSNQYTMTDKNGSFYIDNVPSGEITLTFQFFGMEQLDTTIYAKAGKSVYLKLQMKPTSFHLQNVTVIATQNKAGSSTASNISRQAMDHMQTSSLKDVMALIPGVTITNPSLSSAQSISIRSNNGLAVNSLGTAVIVDGAPMSNNANMQVLTTAMGATNDRDTQSASASTGVDIRSLSTDNIESVEVIRGIPSVEYGDMTAGAVIVKSKAGKSPLAIRFKTNPNIYQVSMAKGFGLKGKAGDLNISGDYAYNIDNIINNLDTYQRANLKALWSVMFAGNSTANTSLSMSYGKQNRDRNPDDTYITESTAENIGLTFNHNGKSFVNKTWLKTINWLVSGNYTNKNSYYRSTASNASSLYSTSMQDGIYTNIGGMEYKDIHGNTITTLHTEEDIKGTVLPYSYPYKYNIYGEEVNVFAKLNFDMGYNWDNVSERLLVGADFKTDGNLGRGSVYDDDFPPLRNLSNTESGYRKRPFYDIPFVTQIGAYAENQLSVRFAGREFNLSAGIRYDWINGKSIFAPRINSSIDVFPWMTLRGGWGITSKAPTAIYLYPNYVYQDILLYNGMDVNYAPEERLLIAKTTVYDVSNPDLEIATNHKAEIGVDFKIANRFRVSVTAYDEKMENGYNFGQDFSSYKWYTAVPYKEVSRNPGSLPTLELAPEKTHTMFFTTYKPMNNIVSRNSGIEYEIDLGRFDAINTSFYINGAWMRGESTNKGYTFGDREQPGTSARHIGIYEPEVRTSFSESMNTTLRITHNIPQIGFAITLTGQFNWYSKYWDEFGMDTMFIGYLNYKDGSVNLFDANEIVARNESMKQDLEFSYMYPTLGDSRFLVERVIPYTIFNLNISKEIKDTMTASFYVNNFLNQRKLYKNTSSTQYTRLGIPIYFGFELKVIIK